MTLPIEKGEELSHGILRGIVGHVNGMGQCFIDICNALNGISENPKVTRNMIINALLEDPNQLLGLESSSDILEQEYGFETSDLHRSTTTFIEKYVEEDLQSGVLEFGLLSKWDKLILLLYHQSMVNPTPTRVNKGCVFPTLGALLSSLCLSVSRPRMKHALVS
jgi:hypothetical protein